MFDLKAKLLASGLVTKEQVAKVDSDKSKKSIREKPDFATFDRQKALLQLIEQSKAEKYLTIRKWVDINRLDKEALVSIDNEKFFFTTTDNQVSWLSLPKEVVAKLSSGNAGVICYMSNHGLVHAVVPRDIAEDVAKVFPEWVKVLNELKE